MRKYQVLVVGCGWLGLPLCELLHELGHQVLTTTTSKEKAETLNLKFSVKVFNVLTESTLKEAHNMDLIIYTIPPIGNGEVEKFFYEMSAQQRIIFISSTSVYGKNQGDVDETSEVLPETKNGKILNQTEKYMRKRFANVTILRPGGLYGYDRHPIYYLAGRIDLDNGDEYLHLVHRNDCLNAIQKIIETEFFGETFNLVHDPTWIKSEYYIEMAKRLGLSSPEYLKTKIENATRISNEKSKKILNLHYLSPIEFRLK